MDRNQFLRQINSLRRQGKSIRAIAAELGVDRGRVARGLQALADFNTGAFVGRQKEMAELRATLDDVFSGRGRLVMLAGEPGIGKTRTAEELSEYAKTLGADVLWGRCQEGGGGLPIGPGYESSAPTFETRTPKPCAERWDMARPISPR